MRTTRPLVAGLVAATLLAAGLIPPAAATTGSSVSPLGVVGETVVELDAQLTSERLIPGVENADGIEVPSRAAEGMQVPTADGDGDDLRIGLPTTSSATVADGGAVIYAESGAQTALIVQALDVDGLPQVESAVRTFITIGSAEAPTRFEFPLDVPVGASVRRLEGGAVAVVDQSGLTLGIFAAPWAVDARGATIPTSFAVEGTTLVQHVLHRGAAYPVIADPVWLVPVIIVGVRAAAQVAVRASTASAARAAAVKAAASQTGRTGVSASGVATAIVFKSYIRKNARHNLTVRTARNPKNCQAHHQMPFKFEREFLARKINIHHPTYLSWWNSTPGLLNNHQSVATAYNNEWERYFKANPKATQKQVLAKRASLNTKYQKFWQC